MNRLKISIYCFVPCKGGKSDLIVMRCKKTKHGAPVTFQGQSLFKGTLWCGTKGVYNPQYTC